MPSWKHHLILFVLAYLFSYLYRTGRLKTYCIESGICPNYAMALSKNDPSSFSNPEECILKQIDLNLDVDFGSSTLKGNVTLNVERQSSDATKLLLDTRDITVNKVFSDGTDLEFNLGDPVLSFGSKLEISLPQNNQKNLAVTIEYQTSTKCTALQWLRPEQTAGKKHPYLFSQCQAIHARSMVPCQDTPAVKTPYTAKITVPKDLVALMSAVKKESTPHPSDSSKVINAFEQKVPIPSYLIAIVVGDLVSRDIGPRSKVWSEKEQIEASAYEFAETEEMLSTAEKLVTPYEWGVYDLLVLPPSFPYGGMENPCLTFVTPTLLAGDRSLADVVAHEIAHSWTGNLVTNRNPEHFWLNEGHTVFVERKIVGRMRGEPHRHFSAIGGWKALRDAVDLYGEQHPYTHLVPKLIGVDPDDAFSSVPYEKGSSLLMVLEQKLGGPEIFEPFLKAYIEKFRNKSIDTTDWKNFLYEFFSEKRSILDEMDWDAWFYASGMPPVKPLFDTSLQEACVNLAKRWTESSDGGLKEFSEDDLRSFSSSQIREFIAELLDSAPLSSSKIAKMQEVYKFNDVKNSEIRFRWIRLCLRAEQESAIQMAVDMVTEQGRMKFTRPLYRDLFNWSKSQDIAIETYKKNKDSMHSITAMMVGKDLKLVS